MNVFRFQPIQMRFSDGVKEDVQLLRVGTFYDDRYGKVEVTPEVLLSMKTNFDKKVRGVDLTIDYKHDSDSVAAGWIKELYLSNDNKELWAKVDWTPNGQKVLSDKEFRYLSADFNFDYQDNESLQKFGPTLFGAGLTNRPVVKNMEPAIALKELTPEGRENMKTEIEKLQAEIVTLKEQNKKLSDAPPAPPKEAAPPAPPLPKDPAKLGDPAPLDPDAAQDEDLMKKIQDLEAQLSQLSAQNKEYAQKYGEMQAAQKMSEQKVSFQKLLAEGRAVPAQEESYLKGDMIKFAEQGRSVNLHGAGHGDNGPGVATGSIDEQVHTLAEKKLSENKSLNGDYKKAISLVLKENPSLANQRQTLF